MGKSTITKYFKTFGKTLYVMNHPNLGKYHARRLLIKLEHYDLVQSFDFGPGVLTLHILLPFYFNLRGFRFTRIFEKNPNRVNRGLPVIKTRTSVNPRVCQMCQKFKSPISPVIFPLLTSSPLYNDQNFVNILVLKVRRSMI